MKNNVFYGIMLRVIILFSIGMAGTFTSDAIQDAGFFGDEIHICADDCDGVYGCVNERGGFSIDADYEWGARHYWYFWMCVTLFFLALANVIIGIINVVNKNYPDI